MALIFIPQKMLMLFFYLSSTIGLHHFSFSASLGLGVKTHSVFQNGHLTKRPGSTSSSSGIFSEHSGLAIGQRGANRQPGGKLPMRGTLPGMAERRSASPRSFGTEFISARV
jgi:hypothetical protein